jgi:uncharacterized protein
VIERRTLSVPRPKVDADRLGYFRYGEIADRMLLTNDAGEWHFLSKADFEAFVAGEIEPGHAEYDALAARGFLRAALNPLDMASKVRRKKFFVDYGPHLAVLITTLRCNQGCKYCHASRTDMDRVDTDMPLEMVEKAVDLALQTTSPYLCFEYTGGEPTVNMPAIRHAVQYAREKNKSLGKIVDHSVVTNMTWMTEENAEWLMENGVLVCTSLDGPPELHNWNRTWVKNAENFPKGVEPASAAAYDKVLEWIQYFNRRYIEMGRDPGLWHVDALMTTTRKTLGMYKDLVDLYVNLGLRNLKIRPLNPYGFATSTWRVIGYSMEEYLDFYGKVLDYILELNMAGVQIQEGTAAIFLKKMLTPDDPNYVDIRSPIGSGTGQIAFHYNGMIYPSDEGRMLAGMTQRDDADLFLLGKLGEASYRDVVGHPSVKALIMSSYLDCLPMCSTCWNVPYCGAMPINNYMEFGDMFGQRPLTQKCNEYMGISRILFERLANDKDGRVEAIFRRWIINRPRDRDE